MFQDNIRKITSLWLEKMAPGQKSCQQRCHHYNRKKLQQENKIVVKETDEKPAESLAWQDLVRGATGNDNVLDHSFISIERLQVNDETYVSSVESNVADETLDADLYPMPLHQEFLENLTDLVFVCTENIQNDFEQLTLEEAML